MIIFYIIVKGERAERFEYYSCPLLLGQRQDSCLVVTKRILKTQGFFPIGALCFLFSSLCFLSNKQDIFTVLEISFCDLEIEKKKIMEWFWVHVYLRLLEEILLRTFFYLEDADLFPYEPLMV